MVDAQFAGLNLAQLEEQIRVARKHIGRSQTCFVFPRSHFLSLPRPTTKAETEKLQALQRDAGLASGVAEEPVGKGPFGESRIF